MTVPPISSGSPQWLDKLSSSNAPPAVARASSVPALSSEPNTTEEFPDSAQSRAGLQDAFHDFVGQTFFAEMLKALRSAQNPSAYFHGGRAEEIFQGQLDQVMTEKLSDASAGQIADPMFELFQLGRPS